MIVILNESSISLHEGEEFIYADEGAVALKPQRSDSIYYKMRRHRTTYTDIHTPPGITINVIPYLKIYEDRHGHENGDWPHRHSDGIGPDRAPIKARKNISYILVNARNLRQPSGARHAVCFTGNLSLTLAKFASVWVRADHMVTKRPTSPSA